MILLFQAGHFKRNLYIKRSMVLFCFLGHLAEGRNTTIHHIQCFGELEKWN